MYGRVTQNTLQQGFNRLKSHVLVAYQKARLIGHLVDTAMNIGRRTYGVLKPLLDQSATGKRVSVATSNALMNYDQLLGDVLSAHDKTHSVIGSLRRAVPEIGL